MSGIEAKDRSRSPRFPTHGLHEAVDYVEKIYDGVHRSPINSSIAYRLMGFAGKSGSSATALGSVRQYGLIEGIGENTRVTDLTLRILEPANEKERYEATVESSRQPEIFRQIRQRFEGNLPRVDEPIRAYLIREMGFSKKGADDCIDALRMTEDYVGSLSEDARSFSDAEVESSHGPKSDGPPFTDSNPTSNFAKIPLSRDCFAELRITGPVTARAMQNLIRQIEIMSEIWSEE